MFVFIFTGRTEMLRVTACFVATAVDVRLKPRLCRPEIKTQTWSLLQLQSYTDTVLGARWERADFSWLMTTVCFTFVCVD